MACLHLKALEMLDLLKARRAETMYLLIDDSKKRKRGKHMEGADDYHVGADTAP